MTKKQPVGNLRMIPVDRIEVLNPRERNKQVFEGISFSKSDQND